MDRVFRVVDRVDRVFRVVDRVDRVFRVVDREVDGEFQHFGPHGLPAFGILRDGTQDGAVDHGHIRLEEGDVVDIIEEPTTVNIYYLLIP